MTNVLTGSTTADQLRAIAADMRATTPGRLCTCEESGHWFSRSICPEPCGSMHDICVDCSLVKGGCAIEAEAGEPSTLDLALAAWISEQADRWDRMVADTTRGSAGVDQPPAVHFGRPEKAAAAADSAFRHAIAVAVAWKEQRS